MAWDECKDMASLGQYVAGDGKTFLRKLEQRLGTLPEGWLPPIQGFMEVRLLAPELNSWSMELKSLTWSCMRPKKSCTAKKNLSRETTRMESLLIMIMSDFLVLLRTLIVLVGT